MESAARARRVLSWALISHWAHWCSFVGKRAESHVGSLQTVLKRGDFMDFEYVYYHGYELNDNNPKYVTFSLRWSKRHADYII